MPGKFGSNFNWVWLGALVAQAAWGAPAAPLAKSTAKSTVAKTQAPVSPWSIDASLSADSSLHHWDDPDHSSSLDLLFVPGYRINSAWKIDLKTSVSKELEELQKLAMADTSLRANFTGWKPSSVVSAATRFSLIAPTSDDSRQVKSLILGASASQKWTYSPSWSGPLSFAYQTAVRVNTFEFRTDANGESNTRWSLAHLFWVNASLAEKWGLEVSPSFTTKYATNGTPSTVFEVYEELSYEISKHWSVAVGHTNSDNAYKENGKDSNLSLSNAQTSKVYLSLIGSY